MTTIITVSSVGVQGPIGPEGPAGPDGPQGPAGQGVPTGGTTDQVLKKNSSTNYDTSWTSLTTSAIPEGTNLYYTDERVDDRVASLLVAGSGINLSYNDLLNTITISATGGGDVSSVFGRTGAVTAQSGDYTTSLVTEGSNLYYTQGRFNSAFAAKSTSDLTEGTNLYYTNARFNTDFSGKSTSDLTEGTNLYYTSSRFNTAFAAKSTSDLSEGTNLYFTNSRVIGALPSQTGNNGKVLSTDGSVLSWTTAGASGVTSVSGTAPVVSSGGATPAISMAASTDSVDGYLTAVDHTTYSASALLTAAATSSNIASAIVKRDTDSRALINQAIEVISSVVSAGATTTLTKSSAHTLLITGTSAQTVVLPNATTLDQGEVYTIINQSTGIVTVQDSSAITLLSMIGKTSSSFKITSIATSAGVWNINKDPNNYGGIAAINGTVTLTTASPRNLAITGASLGSAVLRLPAGNALAVGDTFKITNYFSDANLLTLANNSGTTLLFMPPKTTYEFTSLDNTSAGGTWLVKNLGSGSSTYQLGLMPRISSSGTTEFKSFGQPLGLANSTATYTMSASDNYADYIYSTNTVATGAKQLTLLANNDRLIWVVCGSTGRLNIAVTAGGLINGSSTWSLTQQGQAVLLQNDAGNYKVIATQGTPIESITASTLSPAIYSSDFLLNSVSNNITVTLPSAAESSFIKGKRYGFTKTSANNTVTFNTTSSQTMSGFASGTVFLTKLNSYIEFESDGSNWIISSDGRNFENTHLIGYGTAPTIAGGVGAGTSPTLSLVGVDQAAEISVTAGTVPTAASAIATVSFNKSFSVAPIVTVTPSNANAAAQLVFVTSTTSGYTLTLSTGTLVATTQYKWMCNVMGY